jgi:hypothetical protein
MNFGETSLFPTSFRNGSKYDGQSAAMLNQEALRVIYDFFNHEEVGIDSAIRMLYDSTMQGGVELVWGDAFPLKLSADEQRHVQDACVTALNWKKMFGFCPVKRILPKKSKKEGGEEREKKDSKERDETARFEIPEFGSGAFFMIYDNKTQQSELKYMPYRYGEKHKSNPNRRSPDAIRKLTNGGRNSVNTTELKFPKNYFVFVWPRMMPSLHNGFLKTVTSKLLKQWSIVKQLESNLVVNDTWRSMPPTITKRQPVNVDLKTLTEAEAFGEEELIQPDPLLQKKYQRDISSEYNTQEKSVGFRSRREKVGASQMIMFNTSTGKYEIETLKHPLDPENIFDLEEGMQIEHLDNTSTTSLYLDLKHDYENRIDSTFGVDRANGGGQNSRLKANAEQNRQLLETLVIDERASAALFYATVYEFVHRDNDDLRLLDIRTYMDEEMEILNQKIEADPKDKEAKSRIADLKLQVKSLDKLAKRDLRMKLLFPKNPFTKNIDKQTIDLLIEQKVLTPVEEVNMLRAIGGFEPLGKDSDIIKERSVMRKLEETQREEELSISPLEQAEAEMKAKLKKTTPAAPQKRKAEPSASPDAKKKK